MKLIFANELWLLALPLLGVGTCLLWGYSQRLVRRRLEIFYAARFAKAAMESVDLGQKRLRFWVTVAVLAFLMMALARPLIGPRPQITERKGFDFVVVLDVSKSMLVEDMPPSRLAAVKQDFSAWLKHEAGDRIGLVLFAGDAFTQAPLTFDYDALDFVLTQAGPRSISQGGTDVGKAIERAAEMLEKNPEDSRTLVIISDGEDLQAGAVEAARKAHDKDHLTIFTIGVGTLEGGRVPADDTTTDAGPNPSAHKSYLRDAYGMQAYSRKDERTLRAIATAGGGRFYDFQPGGKTFDMWHDQNLLTLAKKSQKLNVNDYFEWFQAPLLWAILLLMAEPWFRFRKKRTTIAVGVKVVQPEALSQPLPSARPVAAYLVAFALLLGLASGVQGDVVQDADNLIARGQTAEAVNLLKKAAEKNTSDLGLYYNYGLALYRTGQFEQASTVFQTVESTSTDKKLQAMALLQLGNSQYRLGESLKAPQKLVPAALAMEQALGYYESLDASNPTDTSHNNRTVASAQLEQILITLAQQRVQSADAATQQNSLPQAEQALRDALQADNRVQELDPKNTEAKKQEDDARKKLVDNLAKQAEQTAQAADAMQQKTEPAPAASTPPAAPAQTTPQTANTAPATNAPPSAPAPPPAQNQPQTASNPTSAATPPSPGTPPAPNQQSASTAPPPATQPQPPNPNLPPQGKPPPWNRLTPAEQAVSDVVEKRKDAVTKYDQALEQYPTNTPVQAARQEQLNKISDLLTNEAEKKVTDIKAQHEPLNFKALAALEQVGKSLAEAQTDNPNNQKAQALAKDVSQILEQAYIADGEKRMTALDRKGAQPQQQLNIVASAAASFQKALDQNAQSQRAQEDLAKAQAKLPELYAQLAKDDIAQAKKTMAAAPPPPPPAKPGAPPPPKNPATQQAMQKAVGFLEKAAQDYNQATTMKPENEDYKKGLQEAQDLLASTRDQLAQEMQSVAATDPQPTQDPNAPMQADPNQTGPPSQQMSMTGLRGKAEPVTADKFWDQKLKDW